MIDFMFLFLLTHETIRILVIVHEGGQHIQLEKKGHPITDADADVVIHVSSCIERASLDDIDDNTLTLVVENRGIQTCLIRTHLKSF